VKLIDVTERLRNARFLRFGIVGAGGFVVDTVVLYFLFQRLGLPYPVARAISIFTAMNFTWVGNRFLTFRAEAASQPAAVAGEWFRFLATNAVGATVNWAVSNMLVQWAPRPASNPYFALCMGVAVGLVFNFTLSRRFVFRARSPD
jgi:putative flippase GtrA